ncbi:MAG: hypothetical protein CMO01_29395 [Thalassobius sp.]|nr:hypothetical protein [Thalassovita sp.]
MNYNNYQVSDFIADDFFIKWVKSPDAESEYFWQNWLKQHPEKLEEVQNARDLIVSIGYRNQYQPTEDEFIEVLENVHRKQNKFQPKRNFSIVYRALGRAAVIILMLSVGWYYYQDKKVEKVEKTVPKEITYITKSTSRGQNSTLNLPDGSLVRLNAESSLKIPDNFGKENREVFLSGEAFFEVNRDTLRPFIIHSGDLLTTVLGTSFNITSYPDDQLQQIAVVSGRVSVMNLDTSSNNYSKEPALLLPKQLLIYDKESKVNQIKHDIDLENVVAWTEGVLIYQNENLKKILKDLERWYGVEISVSPAVDQTGKYSGTFDNKNLENVLMGLSFTSRNFKYRIKDKKVWIEK